MNREHWLLHPRDPLVLGDGLPVGANTMQRSAELPSPSALAGYARTRWLESQGEITPERAATALNRVAVRGPWLVWDQAGLPRQPWVPVPPMLRVIPGETSRHPPRGLVHHELIAAQASGLGGLGADLPRLVQAPERWARDERVKLKQPRVRYMPLHLAIALALGDAPAESALNPWLHLKDGPIAEEPRTHVALQDDNGTAEDAQLFGTRGMRYHEHAAIGFEVLGAQLPGAPGVEVLGGESRPSFRVRAQAPIWPEWSEVRELYSTAVKQLVARGGPVLLRLQLVTPGCFGGWRPPQTDRLQGLTLVAAAVSGYQAISGWNLQARAPRAVRRLVPAGSVYWYQPANPDQLLALAERFWAEPLSGPAPLRDEFLSTPENDGFGQVLPGFEPLEGAQR